MNDRNITRNILEGILDGIATVRCGECGVKVHRWKAGKARSAILEDVHAGPITVNGYRARDCGAVAVSNVVDICWCEVTDRGDGSIVRHLK
jgi:hypothetical protein